MQCWQFQKLAFVWLNVEKAKTSRGSAPPLWVLCAILGCSMPPLRIFFSSDVVAIVVILEPFGVVFISRDICTSEPKMFFLVYYHFSVYIIYVQEILTPRIALRPKNTEIHVQFPFLSFSFFTDSGHQFWDLFKPFISGYCVFYICRELNILHFIVSHNLIPREVPDVFPDILSRCVVIPPDSIS